MRFLYIRQRVVESLSLVDVFGEFDGVETLLHSYGLLREVNVGALRGCGGWNERVAVRPIVDLPWCDGVAELAVSVVVHHWADGAVNREFLPVYAEAGELGVEVGEVAALEEGVVGEADT